MYNFRLNPVIVTDVIKDITYKFLRDSDGKVESMQIISEYRSKHIGSIFKKYFDLTPNLSKNELLRYCGYYKRDDGRVGSIYLEDGILYTCIYENRPLAIETDGKLYLTCTTLEITFNEDQTELLFNDPLSRSWQFKRFEPKKMNSHEVLPFCGEYLCEADRLERKIYFREGILFYWRNENSESILLPVSKTQFKMMVEVDNAVDFELVKGEWQFAFDVKGDKPSKSVFVKKRI